MALISENRIVAIHQPNYCPWPGYFHKIWQSDVFVFHDTVEHSKRYPTRRTKIRKSHFDPTPVWLSVPLKKHSDFTKIVDLEIDQEQDWPEKHLKKLKNTYQKATFFTNLLPKIELILAEAPSFTSLADWNIYVIKTICSWLGMTREFHRSSELDISGTASQLNIALVRKLGGTCYLSGQGGAGYQIHEEYQTEGISLQYSNFGAYFMGKYTTMPFGFSSLDLLFHLGLSGTIECIKLCPNT